MAQTMLKGFLCMVGLQLEIANCTAVGAQGSSLCKCCQRRHLAYDGAGEEELGWYRYCC